MAPMEGLTDFTYRNAYEKTFGKGRITKYFTPFISPNKSENFLARELRDIDREHNKETYTVVQVMTNEAKDFIWTAKMLYEKYGYSEINLNAGCPSGTVVSKDKGSGMLRDTEKLDRFLDEVLPINQHNLDSASFLLTPMSFEYDSYIPIIIFNVSRTSSVISGVSI